MAAGLTPTSGSVSGDTGASSASSGKGAVLPGATGHAAPKAEGQGESVHPTTSGQPVDALKVATWTQPHQGTDGSHPYGPPTAGAGVAPVLFSPVPPTTLPTPSGQPATGPQGPSWLPEAVHQQVYTAVAPLLRGADGSYGIQLNLHPRDLGAVQVSVDVRHGQIAIQMHATDPAAREALRDGLSDLRQQLEEQGLRTGSMEVGSGGADTRQPEMFRSRSQGIELPNHTRDPSEPLVATAVAASTTALDLRM
jgi:flagellar hook-length control protein FliK